MVIREIFMNEFGRFTILGYRLQAISCSSNQVPRLASVNQGYPVIVRESHGLCREHTDFEVISKL